MSNTVLLVDDHHLIGVTLTSALRLERLDPHWVAGPGDDMDRALRDLDPGLVLLDLDLGVDSTGSPISGAALIPRMVRDGWTVLIVSGVVDEDRLVDAMAHGAIGWVAKGARFEHLVRTVLAAAHGEAVMSADERRRLLARRRSLRSAQTSQQARLESLTARETEILHELAHGRRVSDIARTSHVSVATVRSQVRSIRSKLAVASQLEAVAVYRSAG